MAVIAGALEPSFCEAVIADRLAGIGVDERDRSTWLDGWHNLPVTTTYPIRDVAPLAAAALDELVGGLEACTFADIPDNLIVNFPEPQAAWWSPDEWEAPGAGWHKDGDWFRHFLDSPEQGLLMIVFWRDVVARQGATYVVGDSVAPVARLLAEHPDGLSPTEVVATLPQLVAECSDFRALTGRQGTIVLAHPFLVHSRSVNALDRLRIISNTSVMLRQPMVFDRDDGRYTAVEQSILAALGLTRLDYRAGPRAKVESEREARWRGAVSPDPRSPR